MEIYTVGHSNKTDQEFIILLKKHQIDTLVDVRSFPYSRFVPQFNQKKLSQTLTSYGINYKFLGDCLGGRPKDPTCYKNGTLPEGKANYLELVNYQEVAKRDFYKEGIHRLVNTARDHRTAILCSEEDPNRCHRKHLISKTLIELDITINHIRGDGVLETEMPHTKRKNQLVQYKLGDYGVTV
jgi:uncharacterized protein (DUF488 family)